MLSFFKVNALYNLGSLLVLLIIIRIPVYLYGLPQLIPELQWMLVGEQMNKGFILYSDIWDNTAPLSALVYAGLDSLFGRSQVAFQLMALFFGAVQTIYFNVLVNSRDVFPKRNYVPGLIYVLYLNVSFDCCTLSPVLMGTTFLLLAFGGLVRQISRSGATDEVFEIGFYISVAALFYPPAGLFIFWAILSLVFFSGANARQYSLGVFGFLFPIGLTAMYFYLDNNFDAFYRNFLASVFEIRQYNLNDFKTLLATLLFPMGLGIMGFLRLINAGGFNNFQVRTQQIMMLWAIFGGLSVGLMPFLAPMQFQIFIPCFAFFTVHFFNTIRRAWLAELSFLGVMAAILLIHYQAVYISGVDTFAQLDNLKVKEKAVIGNLKNKRILVLGNGVEEYLNNYAATPYLNWNLARYELENLDNYKNLINILHNFEKDTPEYIIDKENLAPRLFKRIPLLGRKYKKISAGVYLLNS